MTVGQRCSAAPAVSLTGRCGGAPAEVGVVAPLLSPTGGRRTAPMTTKMLGAAAPVHMGEMGGHFGKWSASALDSIQLAAL